MDNLGHDIRYAFRMILRNPAFCLSAILALALGIGANTGIFTVVNSVLLRPLNYADPSRLVVALHEGTHPVSPADFLDYQRGVTAFEQLGAAQGWTGNLTGVDKPEAIPGMQVTGNLLPLLGVPPYIGRLFNRTDEQPGGLNVVVLSHALWQRRFEGDASILGRAIALNGRAYTVVGVMPPDFRFAPFWATQTELWTPLILSARINDRDGRSLRVFGRLRDGISLKQAQAQMDSIAQRLADQYPKTNAKLGIRVVPLQEKVVGPIRPMLLVLVATVTFVFLIACANVANLLLTRAMGRQKEIALRIAIGASRARLFHQLLTESLLLACIGGVAGLALAREGVQLLSHLLPPGSMPRQQEIGFSAATFLFTAAAALVTGVLSGIAPAWHFSTLGLNERLKAGRRRTHGVLISVEVALALVLLAGAGLMVRTFHNLQTVDPGFRPHNLLTLTVSVAGTPHMADGGGPILFQKVTERLTQLPGVAAVSAINHLPIGGDLWTLGYKIPGRPEARPGEGWAAIYRVVRPRYFETMGLALIRGRDFDERDSADSPLVAVINEEMAHRRWPGADPVGQPIVYADGQTRTIVGVVKNARQGDWTSPLNDEIYLPYLQRAQSMGLDAFTFVLRTKTDPARMLQSVQRSIGEIDRGLPISQTMPMEQVIANHLWRSRLSLLLLGLFASIALMLAAVGIYGVISYSVRRRTQEIGIRMALGARKSDVLMLTMREGMLPVFAGTGIGLLAALAMSRWAASLLYGVQATDPLTFAGVTVLLLGVAAVANYLPASGAARVDPLAALKHDS